MKQDGVAVVHDWPCSVSCTYIHTYLHPTMDGCMFHATRERRCMSHGWMPDGRDRTVQNEEPDNLTPPRLSDQLGSGESLLSRSES
jgi:hypothetical protein